MQKLKIAAAVAALIGMSGVAIASDTGSGVPPKRAPAAKPAPAPSAPPPAQPAQNWSGAYAGANAGVASSAQDLSSKTVLDPVYVGGGQLTSTGVFGGGQFGYNFQQASFVYGIEADLGGMSINAKKFSSGYNPGTISNDYIGTTWNYYPENSGGFYGDVTGRFGVAWGPALIYGKGGFAWLTSSFKRGVTSITCDTGVSGVCVNSGTPTQYNHDTSNTLPGWAAGAGINGNSPLTGLSRSSICTSTSAATTTTIIAILTCALGTGVTTMILQSMPSSSA